MTANSFEVKSRDTYVVAASAQNRENALPTIQTAANAATTLAELDAAYAQWDELKRKVNIPTDGYYRIKSAKAKENQNAFISSEDTNVGTDGSLQTAWNANGTMNRNVHRMSASDNFVAQIWKFDQVGDGTYYVRNANNNRLFSSGSPLDMPVEQYGLTGSIKVSSDETITEDNFSTKILSTGHSSWQSADDDEDED